MGGFPWGALGYIVGFGLVVVLIINSPMIIGALIGGIISLFRKNKDDDI